MPITNIVIPIVYMQPFVQWQNAECYVVTNQEVRSVTEYLSEVSQSCQEKYATTTS